jgi:hypothetical protein
MSVQYNTHSISRVLIIRSEFSTHIYYASYRKQKRTKYCGHFRIPEAGVPIASLLSKLAENWSPTSPE